jgi:hypothetical protein
MKAMTLDEWMNQHGYNYSEVAGMLTRMHDDQPAVDASAIRRYVMHGRRPSWERMRDIEVLTKGKVTPNDWVREGAA